MRAKNIEAPIPMSIQPELAKFELWLRQMERPLTALLSSAFVRALKTLLERVVHSVRAQMNKMLRPLLVGLMDMLVSNLIIDRFRDFRHEFEGVKVHMEAVLGTSITF